ncbi:hydroxyacid dehydrogenase [Kordiimonas marina]|uniref:hydroxyacid dehydrogenase n=1 Tax=Kordiimonas marina TaxID=2872312 RepID=UPI001FF10756|nr:hydroxyacid dehydrogenase [Kordiimonas marina]MCJ9430628.1 hydroxyacid dehydrogenase [Kordiimonas marina]
MKLVVFEAEPREAPAFDALKPMIDVQWVDEPLTADNAADYADADVISPFIYSKIDAQALEKLTALKLIATRSTGYDHIDTAWCADHGVMVSNVPSYGENTVAEHVFALLLALSHRLLEGVQKARSDGFSPDGLEGFDLAGKTLGVVGTGNIGRHVIRIAKGFEMEVVATDLYPDSAVAETLGFRYVPLDELLACADIITLHTPATPGTEHLLDAAAFARMKEGVVLINTARGSLIDSRALVGGLKSGKVAAAGLDVLSGEPLIREEAELVSSAFISQHDLSDLLADHVLLRMPNVIITPHSAFNTREAVGRIAATTVANIRTFHEGKPQNLVAAPKGEGDR